MNYKFFVTNGLLLAAILAGGYYNPAILWALVILAPILIIGIYDYFQHDHTVLRNFPIIGHFRYLFEMIRPEINQYFVESDIDGRPFSRIQRSIIYQRAKKELDTEPFGTKMDYNKEGYEWMLHAIHPKPIKKDDLRIQIGGLQCNQPYSSSILNVSAMSFGALGKNAIKALNRGAHKGNFAHNTGEGGISPYHLEGQGDLIWQIGTGYFGCRNDQGKFDRNLFKENATLPSVKMIEIKLSQGAKPGHGGILPGKKNNKEIAATRHVTPYKDVVSPPFHTAFSGEEEMMYFIDEIRNLSGGKPVGFKFCLGHQRDFIKICKVILKTGIYPDFITVDGSEGGTGAAPLEFSNSIGSPIKEALIFVHDTLLGFNLREEIKVIASGKVVTGFDIIRFLALGADGCNSARAMMMALGCIQALRCNTNQCPTGVATQNKILNRGLVVSDKEKRVANYHYETIKSVKEMVAASGIENFNHLSRSFIAKKVNTNNIKTLDQIYPYPRKGSLLHPPYPEKFQQLMLSSN